MSDSACGCDGASEAQSSDRTEPTDRWVGDGPAADAPLPRDVARATSRFYTAGPIETLGDFVEATRAEAGGSLDVGDLCRVDGRTPHVARTADGTGHFRCFYDGVALAYLADEPVEVHTESPSGTPIALRATPDGEVDAIPSGAVMSLGIAADATDDPDASPTDEEVEGSVCPYVKAFPTRERYRGWAAAVDGATVGLPLTTGTTVAAALTA